MAHVYTSYFAHYKKFPKDAVKISIARFPPPKWDGASIPDLAPSEELLKEYKNNYIDKYMFEIKYYEELNQRGFTPQDIWHIFNKIDNNIILCCYEKPEDFCHRHLLAKWLKGDIQELL